MYNNSRMEKITGEYLEIFNSFLYCTTILEKQLLLSFTLDFFYSNNKCNCKCASHSNENECLSENKNESSSKNENESSSKNENESSNENENECSSKNENENENKYNILNFLLTNENLDLNIQDVYDKFNLFTKCNWIAKIMFPLQENQVNIEAFKIYKQDLINQIVKLYDKEFSPKISKFINSSIRISNKTKIMKYFRETDYPDEIRDELIDILFNNQPFNDCIYYLVTDIISYYPTFGKVITDAKNKIWQNIYKHEIKYIDDIDLTHYFQGIIICFTEFCNFDPIIVLVNKIKSRYKKKMMNYYLTSPATFNPSSKYLNNIPYSNLSHLQLKLIAKNFKIPNYSTKSRKNLFTNLKTIFKDEHARTCRYELSAFKGGYGCDINLLICDSWDQVDNLYKISFKENNVKYCYDMRDLLADIESKLTTNSAVGIDPQWPYFLDINQYNPQFSQTGKILFKYNFLDKLYNHVSYNELQTSRFLIRKMKFPITHLFLQNLNVLYKYREKIIFSKRLEVVDTFYYQFKLLLKKKYNIVETEIQNSLGEYQYIFKTHRCCYDDDDDYDDDVDDDYDYEDDEDDEDDDDDDDDDFSDDNYTDYDEEDACDDACEEDACEDVICEKDTCEKDA